MGWGLLLPVRSGMEAYDGGSVVVGGLLVDAAFGVSRLGRGVVAARPFLTPQSEGYGYLKVVYPIQSEPAVWGEAAQGGR